MTLPETLTTAQERRPGFPGSLAAFASDRTERKSVSRISAVFLRMRLESASVFRETFIRINHSM